MDRGLVWEPLLCNKGLDHGPQVLNYELWDACVPRLHRSAVGLGSWCPYPWPAPLPLLGLP